MASLMRGERSPPCSQLGNPPGWWVRDGPPSTGSLKAGPHCPTTPYSHPWVPTDPPQGHTPIQKGDGASSLCPAQTGTVPQQQKYLIQNPNAKHTGKQSLGCKSCPQSSCHPRSPRAAPRSQCGSAGQVGRRISAGGWHTERRTLKMPASIWG